VELKTGTAKHGTQTRNSCQKKGYQNRTRDAKHELTFGGKKKNAGEEKATAITIASEGYMCDASIASFSRVCLGALCGGIVGVPWSGLRRVEEDKKRVSLEEE
jgi:hypothetical protein